MRLIAVSTVVCIFVAVLLSFASEYVPPPSRCPPGMQEIAVKVYGEWRLSRVICAVVPAGDRP